MRRFIATVMALHGQVAIAADNWQPHAASDGPPTSSHGVALDVAREELVVVAGSETWTWTESAWLQVAADPLPPARFFPALAYDAQRERVVLFGGFAGGSFLADTWEFDGNTWVDASPAVGPPGRSQAALAFDSARHVVVLFGGVGAGAELADTWLWDGAEWRDATPVTGSPSARSFHALAYDSSRESVLLLGGSADEADGFWEWDGAAWTGMPTAPFATSQLVGLASLGRCAVTFTASGETWLWDGAAAAWSQLLTDNSPGARTGFVMAGDTLRGRAFLFGGAADSRLWELTVASCNSAPNEPPSPGGLPTGCGCKQTSSSATVWLGALALFVLRRRRTALLAVPLLAGCGFQQFVEVSAGATHSCGLTDDGRAVCWGENDQGSVVAPSGQFRLVRAGTSMSCGLRENGDAECWGFLAPPSRDGPFQSLEAGSGTACGLREEDGTIECWSRSPDNPLLDVPAGTFQSLSVDVLGCALDQSSLPHCWPNSEVPSIELRMLDVSVFGCGIRLADDLVECWGGQERPTPPEEPFAHVAVGVAHACALRADGTISCWGLEEDGRTSPPSGEFTQISAGSAHACARRADATVECWGRNEHGQTHNP